MTFARFEVTNFTGAGKIEVVTEEGIQVWTPGDSYAVVGEQGTLWKGTWPRLRPPERPALRLIQGGKA